MTPVQRRLAARLQELPSAFAPLWNHALRYVRHCSSEGLDGTLQIGHMPWVAPAAHAVWIFPPAKKSWCTAFRERAATPLPKHYREFLLATNGCFVHGLSFYGLPPLLQGDDPRLDRTRLQPLDLVTANLHWRVAYRGCSDLFHFGARHLTANSDVGYFVDDEGLRSVLANGEVVARWKDLPSLLAEELAAAEHFAAGELNAGGWHVRSR